MALLDINGLLISFGGIQALAGIDLTMRQEEILSVIGPNGSGKTTLFNCISGVYKKDGGEILFQGESLERVSPVHFKTCAFSFI
jgi:branched-chain amino acid transport system ATP-binding protein